MVQVCYDNNLLIVNGLQTDNKSFPNGLTFRRRKRWISDLDKCVVSKDLIERIESFSIDQDTRFPSDHAPISIKIGFPAKIPDTATLYETATNLDTHAISETKSKTSKCKKVIPLSAVDAVCFGESICKYEQVVLESLQTGNPETAAGIISESLYDCMEQSTIQNDNSPTTDPSIPRWKKIIDMKDEKALWDAVGWNGDISISTSIESNDKDPSEGDFQKHLEALLNPAHPEQSDITVLNDNVTIPMLDRQIEMNELDDVINHLKPKGIGPDGVHPGVFKWLPRAWVCLILLLMNLVFICGYPLCWAAAKLSMIFKKGTRSVCDNYRGISVINCCSKIYDYIINNRLMLWFKASREQAGGQRGRGCIELIVCLRLLISFCKRKRKKLFIVFVDFSKAYDRVPRGKLFRVLKSLGCGSIMLAAIMGMYKTTTCILGSTTITSTIGVRQGSPTSCLLFIIFVEMLIRLIKNNVNTDSFLGWLHVLMLMDDTVIMATSRERLIEKLKFLDQYCKDYGMIMNEKKTKLMVINGNEYDNEPIQLNSINIKHTDKYVYLGAIITADGSTASSIKQHAKDKEKSLNKLIIFLASNRDAPFFVKMKVFRAAFTASILYSMESWIGTSTQHLEHLYSKGVRCLLGVRSSSPIDLCLIECGLPSMQSLIADAQRRFFKKMLPRMDLADDPLGYVLNLIQMEDPTMWNNIQKVINIENHTKLFNDDLRTNIQNNDSRRPSTYKSLNPQLSVHELYTSKSVFIPDNLRINFTRLRLSSHRLRVETGRWSDTPRDKRVCVCGTFQDEEHVLVCSLNTDILRNYEYYEGHLGLLHLFEKLDVKNLTMLSELLKNTER